MNPERLIQNRTPLEVRAIPLEDRRGHDVIAVIAKLTWDVSGVAPRLGWPQEAVRVADAWNDGGRWSSVKYPSDLVADRPGTDVLLVGTAHPIEPGATEQDVRLRVESGARSLVKTLRVTGPRVWMRGVLGMQAGPPARLLPTPLVYELAYGGVDESDPNDLLVDLRNPSGNGVQRDKTALAGTPAPVIEDPKAPLGSRSPAPAGFGPIPAGWLPRASHAGTMDAAWRKERAPLAPLDQDPRYASCAPPDQHVDPPLFGDEAFEVFGATPEGVLRFKLPRHGVLFEVVVRGDVRQVRAQPDTILVDADRRLVEHTFRTAVRIPRRVDDLEAVRVFCDPPLSDALIDDLAGRGGPADEGRAA